MPLFLLFGSHVSFCLGMGLGWIPMSDTAKVVARLEISLEILRVLN